MTDPVFGTRSYPSPIVAGSYLSIAVAGGSVSPKALSDVQARLESTKATLESQDQALIAGLGREDILGDMFHAGTLGYFAEYSALAHMMGLAQGNHMQLATSVGTYGYVPRVNYFFGFPRSIEQGGVEMDLDRVAHAASVDGKGQEAKFNFTFQLGALSSALEHGIPEQMFVTPENPGEAVSAVKALQKASAAGQRIYHITAENQAATLPNIHHSSATMQEIRQALAVGKEVITHTDAISVPGWTGAGYVIYDPAVGDGAWKIGGGMNGGGSKSGPLDFTMAVANQPGLLIPNCALPFFEQMAKNFVETNKAIFGLAAPPGTTLLTAGAAAEAASGFTMLKGIRLATKNPTFLVPNIAFALAISLINYMLVSLVFEIGILIGSGISAAFCRRE